MIENDEVGFLPTLRSTNNMNDQLLDLVRETARKKILFLPHAVRQMSRLDRMISPSDIHDVLENGEMIENYPEDRRGHSCLILGFDRNNRAIHVVCSPKEEYLAVITAYLPVTRLWSQNFKERKSL